MRYQPLEVRLFLFIPFSQFSGNKSVRLRGFIVRGKQLLFCNLFGCFYHFVFDSCYLALIIITFTTFKYTTELHVHFYLVAESLRYNQNYYVALMETFHFWLCQRSACNAE